MVTFSGCGFLDSLTPAPEATAAPVSTTVNEVDAPPSSSDGETTASSRYTVTELEQIVGTWIAPAYPGNYVLTVFPDGKLSVATSLEALEAGSTNSWNLTIEDGQITATDFALCWGDVGIYIAEISEEGNLRFLSVFDACDARVRQMDRSLPGRLNPYILIFRPVQ
jgi:hypothetical protein